MRLPMWCRWCFPWLPFGDEGRKIARGTEVTGADGTFTIRFPAVPDRSVPKAALPVFTYEVVADVTDPSGETRSDTRNVAAGYADVEATIERSDWQAVAAGVKDDRGQPAAPGDAHARDAVARRRAPGRHGHPRHPRTRAACHRRSR